MKKKYYRTQRARDFVLSFAQDVDEPFTTLDVMDAWNEKYKHHAMGIKSMAQMLRMSKGLDKVGRKLVGRNYYYLYEYRRNENVMDRKIQTKIDD